MMNRWQVYEFLKNTNGGMNSQTVKMFSAQMSKHEVTEGIIEYNLMAERSDGRFTPTRTKVTV